MICTNEMLLIQQFFYLKINQIMPHTSHVSLSFCVFFLSVLCKEKKYDIICVRIGERKRKKRETILFGSFSL